MIVGLPSDFFGHRRASGRARACACRAGHGPTVPVREGTPTAPARAWEFLNGNHAIGRRWLLVFDGADNPAVLAGPDAPQVQIADAIAAEFANP